MDILMPKVGLTMTEGVIVEWHKHPGDWVRRGEVLFTFETEKSTLDFESPAEGLLTDILAPTGEPIPCLTPVAAIRQQTADDRRQTTDHRQQTTDDRQQITDHRQQTADDRPQTTDHRQQTADDKQQTTDHGSRSAETGQSSIQNPKSALASPRARALARERAIDLAAVSGTAPGGVIVARDVLAALQQPDNVSPTTPVRATPVAQRMAADLGVDLASLSGSGPDGRITREDVERAARAANRQPSQASYLALSPARRVTAQRLAESVRTAPQVTLTTEADATGLVSAREQLSVELGEKVSYNTLLAMIAARALKEHPNLNAAWDESGGAPRVLLRDGIHISIAVDTERGLYVPVLRDCATKSLAQLHRELNDLIARAIAGRLSPDQMLGGTFTITNLGMYEIDAFTPILNLPEAAILGVGRILARPVALENQVVIRQMMTLSLTFDHRVVDGAPAARFLQRLKTLIERPFALLV